MDFRYCSENHLHGHRARELQSSEVVETVELNVGSVLAVAVGLVLL